MTLVTFSDGKVVMRDGKVGTEQGCCCGGGCTSDDQCCICYGSYAKLDPGDACIAPFQQDPNDPTRCEFYGQFLQCPDFNDAEAVTQAQIACNNAHPETLVAVTTLGPIPGFCCAGQCQAECEEAAPP